MTSLCSEKNIINHTEFLQVAVLTGEHVRGTTGNNLLQHHDSKDSTENKTVAEEAMESTADGKGTTENNTMTKAPKSNIVTGIHTTDIKSLRKPYRQEIFGCKNALNIQRGNS